MTNSKEKQVDLLLNHLGANFNQVNNSVLFKIIEKLLDDLRSRSSTVIMNIVKSLRPNIIFGADIIAGFPTETDKMFQDTVNLLKEINVIYLHAFPYSERKNTPAAKMPQVPENVRKERVKHLRKVNKEMMTSFLQSLVDAKHITTPFEQPIYDYGSSADEYILKRISTKKLPSEIKLQKKSIDVNSQLQDDKVYGFYTSIGCGRIFYDNSEVFVEGIKAIGERVQDLVKEDSYLSAFIKRIIAKEVDDINKFKGAIDFQWLGSSSLGYHVKENGRVDFEIMYSQINIKNSSDTPVFDKSASILALLLNLHYSPTIKNTKFAPYVGLGIGPTIFRLKKFSKSLQNPIPLNVPWFAYQAKLGVDYSIIPEMNLFLGYRYFSIPIPVADDITTHSIEVGLRFNF
ncbi:Outer membrane protein/outer membrane enzyme PagP, beta-barrel,Radical SAM, alpha/beta horseshoe,Outer [Cinara cedri]|uniref:Outer membrane protein/outer membrane enzyme PagP, beta-barrel,Radical SAM, alpha/beta horseshoe,Outer n=1 Tax=Cinara cedri TaxID=506608 RepID=A0A5E4N9J6_9HEMI|nr:Outer membrane protein/outer membrane enzyme PagP, beta-barrel,Radical SAM, alpha/beta horseshoe,Outer [Cinara cedri]